MDEYNTSVPQPGSSTASNDALSPEEFCEAERKLSDEDRLKLISIERLLLGGTGRQQGELYGEALTRTLLGHRKCPKDCLPIAFLIQTMKSIAYHDRKSMRRSLPFDENDGPQFENVQLPTESSPEEKLIASEENTEASIVIETLHKHFDGDDEARLLMMAWSEGWRGKELREAIGVDQTKLDYLIKRVRRAAFKVYPKGWQP